MRAPYKYIISPEGGRYNNTKQVGHLKLIKSSSIEDARDVNRIGIVIATPICYDSDINVGDRVVVHHNVFREFYDINGNRKYSQSHFKDKLHTISYDSIYLYEKEIWRSNSDYIFIKPIDRYNKYTLREQEAELMGEVYYENGKFKKGDIISFTPESEYEFEIDGEKLYRMRVRDICLIF